jgi:hypothetical protein
MFFAVVAATVNVPPGGSRCAVHELAPVLQQGCRPPQSPESAVAVTGTAATTSWDAWSVMPRRSANPPARALRQSGPWSDADQACVEC